MERQMLNALQLVQPVLELQLMWLPILKSRLVQKDLVLEDLPKLEQHLQWIWIL